MPEMKNHLLIPIISATGLAMASPIGIVTDEVTDSKENALPIFSREMVSCI